MAGRTPGSSRTRERRRGARRVVRRRDSPRSIPDRYRRPTGGVCGLARPTRVGRGRGRGPFAVHHAPARGTGRPERLGSGRAVARQPESPDPDERLTAAVPGVGHERRPLPPAGAAIAATPGDCRRRRPGRGHPLPERGAGRNGVGGVPDDLRLHRDPPRQSEASRDDRSHRSRALRAARRAERTGAAGQGTWRREITSRGEQLPRVLLLRRREPGGPRSAAARLGQLDGE